MQSHPLGKLIGNIANADKCACGDFFGIGRLQWMDKISNKDLSERTIQFQIEIGLDIREDGNGLNTP